MLSWRPLRWYQCVCHLTFSNLHVARLWNLSLLLHALRACFLDAEESVILDVMLFFNIYILLFFAGNSRSLVVEQKLGVWGTSWHLWVVLRWKMMMWYPGNYAPLTRKSLLEEQQHSRYFRDGEIFQFSLQLLVFQFCFETETFRLVIEGESGGLSHP